MKLLNLLMVIMLLIYLPMALASCSRYIDKVKSPTFYPVSDGKMEIFRDSNVLIYKSKVALKADQYVWYPKSFYTQFPKQLKWYEFLGDDFFSFYYKNKQVILISLDLQKSTNAPYTTSTPSAEEVDSLISKRPLPRAKYDVSRIAFIPGRKNYLMRRNSACILFYNIEEKNLPSFVASLKTFKFIE